MSFVIEKDIPMPEFRKSYPFGKMEIGDSIFVTGPKKVSAKVASSKYGKAHGKTFASSFVDGGVRIWRTE